ncbi:MAG TPA: pyruvate dehydrogenase (acetyl-transferring) E1 component subunit alpha [Anaerolineae bacterium]|nr:pyruvate dehydrogenase (acetyl-transferring) E1 component subunit alpha [Anaerolineae bacterium]
MVAPVSQAISVQEKPALDLSRETALHWLEQMMLIRRFEEAAEYAYTQKKVGGFLHLYIGEESIAVGAVAALRPNDDIFTHYRDHGWVLARGVDPKPAMAELYGKATGLVKGKGGSMHFASVEHHMWGGYAIVGGHIPLAVGMAFSHQYLERDRIAFCVMGEGATNIGMFHEALNMAALWKLPVVFLVENNVYGMGTAVQRASATPDIYEKAEAYRMPATQIDGNDVELVYHTIQEFAERARRGEGPQMVEAMTYRFRGHSMGDPQRYRTKDEVEQRRPDDPINRWESKLLERGWTTEDEIKQLFARADQRIAEAVQYAEDSPFPDPSELYTDILVEE